MEEIRITAPDGKTLSACQWLVDSPVGLVQICHGLVEHVSRYDRLAEFLNQHGYSVFGHDMRGHGSTLEANETPGFVAEKNAERLLIEDVRTVARHYRKDAALPLYLFGHSMGALVASGTLQRYPDHAQGLLLSALPEFRPGLNYMGQGIAAAQAGFRGSRSLAKLHTRLSFGQYNRQFRPNRTAFDWISSRDEEVDNYVNDPMCGFPASVQLFRDLMDLLHHSHDVNRWTSANRNLPVFAIAGAEDPVSGRERGILKSMDHLKRALPKLEFRVFEGSRHEVLWDRDSESAMKSLVGEIRNWNKSLERPDDSGNHPIG